MGKSKARGATTFVAASFLIGGAIFSAAFADEGPDRTAGPRAVDPGPRPNPSSVVPKAVDGLNDNEKALFHESLLRVSELEGSCETCAQQPQNQLPVDPDPNNPCAWQEQRLHCVSGSALLSFRQNNPD